MKFKIAVDNRVRLSCLTCCSRFSAPRNLCWRFKFEGIAMQQAGRLFCVIQQSKMRKSTSGIVLSRGDFGNATTLDGLILGTEPETGNEITTYQTIWR
ncbi:hypothetical protein KUV26_21945 [Leisingera daeponensis]|uniref:Uncharacterized protein n=1 Tax=Leisingera daeponensis TaxID=405746 RepID=A0ABS7NLM3_9RHOB|nr:hypothetical protein [Leisingera daeponensis]MBY6142105.1 hypothetical protein [Leisingera daeponensis]